jgi:hypothetical protein
VTRGPAALEAAWGIAVPAWGIAVPGWVCAGAGWAARVQETRAQAIRAR